jgi:hypothetical protein
MGLVGVSICGQVIACGDDSSTTSGGTDAGNGSKDASPGNTTDGTVAVQDSGSGGQDSGNTTMDSGGGTDAGNAVDANDGAVPLFTSCLAMHAGMPALPSGEYTIDADGPGPLASFKVYCEMDYAGGGWTLFERYIFDGATGGVGPGDIQADAGGTEVLRSSSLPQYMPYVRLEALLTTATQVHVRTPFTTDGGTDAGLGPEAGPGLKWVTSLKLGTETDAGYDIDGVVTAWPIYNLRRGRVMNMEAPFGTQETIYQGPNLPNLTYSCPVNATYPAVHHACNNGNGLHIIGNAADWDLGIGYEPIEVYIR